MLLLYYFVINKCFYTCERRNSADEWKKISAKQERWVKYLDAKETFPDMELKILQETCFLMKRLVELCMAIGDSMPEAGGLNRSTIHWDMLCNMK